MFHATVTLPGSKSITNRAHILNFLSTTPAQLHNTLASEDTERMLDCIQKIQNRSSSITVLFVGNSGTTIRFILPALLHHPGTYHVDGVPRMRQRPIASLIHALRQLGATITCLEKPDALPLRIQTSTIKSTSATIDVEQTSQFLSGLLMALPLASSPSIILRLSGALQSLPYIEITLRMMQQYGLKQLPEYDPASHSYTITGNQKYHPPLHYAIEPDASAASYFMALAAIHPGSSVTLPGLTPLSLQGDVAFANLLAQMGAKVTHTPEAIQITGTHTLQGIDVDMNTISDTVMTLAAIAPLASTPTTIRNVAHIRLKECDRITATATELKRLGVTVEEFPDGLRIYPASTLRPAAIHTYEDHRIAMAFAILATRHEGITICNPSCVAKTFPDFFTVLKETLSQKAS